MFMNLFELHRDVDETGLSGTGIIAEGVEFTDGSVSLRWRTYYKSTAFYESIDDLVKIHGHDGKTRLVWLED
jgi:hypothetical protein